MVARDANAYNDSFERQLKIKTVGMHTSSLYPSLLENHTKTRYTKYIASHSFILLETVKFMISKNVNNRCYRAVHHYTEITICFTAKNTEL